MTPRDEIRQAEQEAAESKLRAQQELRQARERAKRTRSITQRLRELREANGFASLLDDAFGGSHG